MHPDIDHALALLDDAIRSGDDDARRGPDACEAITTLEAVDRTYAETLWRQLAPPFPCSIAARTRVICNLILSKLSIVSSFISLRYAIR